MGKIQKKDQEASGSGGYGQTVAYDEGECCPPVVDPLSLIGILGGIAAITLAFRQQVQQNIMAVGRKKRATPDEKFTSSLMEGTFVQA